MPSVRLHKGFSPYSFVATVAAAVSFMQAQGHKPLCDGAISPVVLDDSSMLAAVGRTSEDRVPYMAADTVNCRILISHSAQEDRVPSFYRYYRTGVWHEVGHIYDLPHSDSGFMQTPMVEPL